ncbi:type 2 periplasmic-binding domain-containing protein [Salinimonas lutimaris]|uniref:phosphate ABC transporter substrate-binding protein n=1 Tax=Salinimonas lutimaris TaxID=914153 RepID=UPI001C30F82F|nr:phosphate ABC transporter substrate-binding protein [Salinimonas lutimaris]
MKFIKSLKITSLIAASLASHFAFAEVAVVVNPANGAALDQAQVSKLFLGKDKTLTPLMQQGSASDEFVEKALSRSPSQYKAYWAKLAFTGGGRPPESAAAADVLSKVSSDPGAIGVVDASAVNDSVKVLFTL